MSANFQELMSMAKQNAAEAKKRAANAHMFPDTGKKRADPKQVKLKEGVAKFLAKRDEEERRQRELDRQKKDKLLELRNQDRKATNRVRKMLSMTKSANKSCMDDSKDCLNDSVTAQAQGDFQPDEDDYGYTSKYADEMHKKMMDKYKAMPVKPAFPQSRVPVPMSQSLPSKNGTGWRKPKGDYEPEGEASPEQSHHEDIAPPTKPERLKKVPIKNKKPPPPDYHQLLQLAQEKAQQPLPALPVVDKKGGERDEFEFGRPMTAKEKASHLALKELRERAARKYSDKNNNNSSSSSSAADNRNAKPTASFKIPKANSKTRVEEDRIESPPQPPLKKAKHVAEPVRASTSEAARPRPSEHVSNGSSSSLSRSGSLPSKVNGHKSSSSPTSSRPTERVRQSSHISPHSTPTQSSSRPRERDSSVSQKSNGHSSRPEQYKKPEKIPQERLELIKEKPRYLSAFEGRKETHRDPEADRPRKQPPPSNDSRKAARPSTSRDVSQSRPNESRDRGRDERGREDRGREERYRDERVRDDRGRDERGRDGRGAPDRHNSQKPIPRDRDRDRLPPPQRRDIPRSRTPPRMRDEPPPRMKPKFKGRAVIDSDEEYDSEMDDFIDDSEVDMPSISAEISKIFKYDRRRFHDEESDDECMESSFGEQFREEQRSLRIGIQEDLEDIRREEEEKRRMMMKKKARR